MGAYLKKDSLSAKLCIIDCDNGEQLMQFHCPGCQAAHMIRMRGRNPWTWNGNAEHPTFTPSVLVTWTEPSDDPALFDDPAHDKRMVCHSFITNGRIQFLPDSTHSLAGHTVDLPDLP